mmetsp:Transcript_15337/g.33362  ORF Transcript_15337/g.33362 Transcript_15337/m.33362 type:complete len:124 (-) Transcript_15337:273-644(-)
MIRRNSRVLLAVEVFAIVITAASAFVQPSTSVLPGSSIGSTCTRPTCTSAVPSSDLLADAANTIPSTVISAGTVDPTSLLSGILGGLLGSPAILLVPILAAVSVASVVAFFIVWYANPADEDE